MYHASDDFHTAVANGAHQIALLIFGYGNTDADLAVFTNDDINVSAGIEFNDYFNAEEDIAIGQALSNEISFNLFNDQGLLNDYEFGEFKATIGAQTGNDLLDADHKTVYLVSGEKTFETFTTSPYLKVNGTAVSSQPAYPVVSILVYNGKVYCGMEDGNIKTYNYSNMSAATYTPNDFMKAQMQKWKGKGLDYAIGSGTTNDMLTIYQRNIKRTYEFVPLGVFVAERPNVPSVNEIHMTCYDRMQKFEKDMVSFSELSLPGTTTIANLYGALCTNVGVTKATQTLINGDAQVKETDDFGNVTMREVLQWIAEACASIARFDRDGVLKMDWIRESGMELDETGYSDFAPYWYETKRITKLYNRASNGDYDKSAGNGDEAYLIQDNPLLKGVSGTNG